MPALTDEKTFEKVSRRPWIAAAVAGLLIVGGGLALWLPAAGGTADANSDLGSAVLGGAVVGFAVLLLQWRFEQIATSREEIAAEAQRLRDEAAEEERRRQETRAHTELVVMLSDDLTGFDLRGRDLSGFYLRGRRLDSARLDGAQLSAANLSYASLAGATLTGTLLREGAYLEAASLPGADLEGAELVGAYMRGCDLTGAFLQRADLERADLGQADLRDCDLRRALNAESADFSGARYDARTQWPGEAPAAAVEIASDDPWRCAAAEAVQAK